jgi:hypothetical protein
VAVTLIAVTKQFISLVPELFVILGKGGVVFEVIVIVEVAEHPLELVTVTE